MDNLNDKKIMNSISYIINKKINLYNDKLDNILKKSDENYELLKQNNLQLIEIINILLQQGAGDVSQPGAGDVSRMSLGFNPETQVGGFQINNKKEDFIDNNSTICGRIEKKSRETKSHETKSHITGLESLITSVLPESNIEKYNNNLHGFNSIHEMGIDLRIVDVMNESIQSLSQNFNQVTCNSQPCAGDEVARHQGWTPETRVVGVHLNHIVEEVKKIDKKEIKNSNKSKKIEKTSNAKISNDSSIDNYMEVKKEFFDIDEDFIKKCLDMNSIHGDIELFQKMYINTIPKEYYPIRHIKKKFQYWLDGHMNDDDSNASYIKNIILQNIEDCYLRVNNYDNYMDDMDQFLKNQEHINRLMEQKYKDKFLLKIISIITI